MQKPSRKPVDEVIAPTESGPLFESAPEWNFPDDDYEDESLLQQQQSGELFAENEFDYPPEANDVINEDKVNQGNDVRKIDEINQNDKRLLKNDVIENESRIKELENEKEELQKRLSDAKNALSEYSSKLDDQVEY